MNEAAITAADQRNTYEERADARKAMKTLKSTQVSLRTLVTATLLTSLLFANIAVGINNRRQMVALEQQNAITRQFAFDTYKMANGEIAKPKTAAEQLAVVENGGH